MPVQGGVRVLLLVAEVSPDSIKVSSRLKQNYSIILIAVNHFESKMSATFASASLNFPPGKFLTVPLFIYILSN